MHDADMLEHADRDDAVELPFHGAVVAKLEGNGLGEALGAGPLLRQLELFLAQGHAR